MSDCNHTAADSCLRGDECAQCLRDAASSFAAPSGSAAPSWYNAEEIRHWLRRNKYSEQIADDLCGPYAAMLQKAFEKGYEIGKREAARQNDKLTHG